MFLTLLLSQGCSDESNPTGPGGTPSPEILPPNPAGMLMPGEESDDATAATVSLTPSPAPAAEIAGTLLTTRLAAVIAPGATVGEVNTALADQSAAIVSMAEGNSYVVLVIDAVADRAEAEAAAAELVATDAFIYARPGLSVSRGRGTDAAKDFPDETAGVNLAHLTASRTQAAWNLRRAAEDRAALVVPEWYADVPGYLEVPDLEFITTGGRPVTPEDGAAYTAGSMGFYLLGVAAANWDYDPDFSPHTGVDPAAAELLDVYAVHTYGLDDSEKLWAAAYGIPDDGNVVLLTTETFDDPDGELIRYIDRAWLGLYWRRMVLGVMDGRQFTHVVAAGHTGTADASFNDAALNSSFGLAIVEDLAAIAVLDATDSELAAFQMAYQNDIATLPAIGEPMDNVILVGSSGATGAESEFSTPGSHVRTVGEAVPGPCLGGPGCVGVTMHVDDSAAAAAQVAGLAGYLWHLDPELSVPDMLLRLQHAYSASALPGVLDAWIAALSVDTSLYDAPARKTLLDVSGPSGVPDGLFTEYDLTAFTSAFEAFGGAISPDWSVYDLNGDGWTGGSGESRMDLDINNLPGFSTVTRDINGEEVTFDETRITDEEVLCYYAWSDLYTGDATQRASLLDCGGGDGLFVQVTGMPERASPGETALVTVTAGFNLPGGGVSHEAGIHISFNSDGLEVVPSDGLTNASGVFLATVTFGDSRNRMELGTWAESAIEASYAEVSALRHNEVELVERNVYILAAVYATYSPGAGIPNVEFINEFDDAYSIILETFDERIRRPEGGGAVSGSAAGMNASGMALIDLTTTVDFDSGTNFSGMTFTGESNGSITLSNPNFQVQSYLASSEAYAELDLSFIVWGEPAIYSLQGNVSSELYDIDFDGPDGQVYLCDSEDMPCSTISSSGTLQPGRYDLDLYNSDGGRIWWHENCDDCTTSGTQGSSGFLDVTFEIFHAGN